MAALTKKFWLVAYYLSKFGNGSDSNKNLPPEELETAKWNEAYKMFFHALGDGKPLNQFEHSLKNARDAFDAHIGSSNRKGWRDSNNKPAKLPPLAKSVYNEYNSLGRESIWFLIRELISSIKTDDPSSKKTEKHNKNKKNPDWNREEIILALDLYFKMDYGQMHGRNPSVIQLSNDLRKLNIHSAISDVDKFRSVNSVALKLANLKKSDQNFNGKGMKDGGKLEREIWNEFHRHRDKLKNEAEQIRHIYLNAKSESKPNETHKKKEKSGFLFQIHKNRENDPLIIKQKKEAARENQLTVKCEVCKFDPTAFYGELGDDILEIHYLKELTTEPKLETNSVEDFAFVCSDCHKVLDKHFDLLSIEDLRKIIRKR